jgi:hypothetical protein
MCPGGADSTFLLKPAKRIAAFANVPAQIVEKFDHVGQQICRTEDYGHDPNVGEDEFENVHGWD